MCSLHGSPGATTLALALTVALQVGGQASLFLEADPDGGVVAARFDVPSAPSLTDLAAAARRPLGADEVMRYAQPIGAGVLAVVAHPSPEQTRTALLTGAPSLAAALRATERRTVVDLGRWRSDSPCRPLFDTADTLLLVMRPTLEQTVQVLHLLDALPDPHRLRLVVVGNRPYSARQVADTTQQVVVATLPFAAREVFIDPFLVATRRRDHWHHAVEGLAASLVGSGTGARRPDSPER